MAHILIITHACDDFRERNLLLGNLATHWIGAGHRVHTVAGLGDWPDADIAVMHVDLSVVPAAYSEAARRYPILINGAVTDIRKSRVSRNLLQRHDEWTGPVVVKTELNYNGNPERHALEVCRTRNLVPDFAVSGTCTLDTPYPILGSLRDVSDAVWGDPGLVVERFLPEFEAGSFWMRAWVFCGDRERCTRYRGTHPIVKADAVIARETVDVPDALRAERERLGFDYGKFDFVVRDGQPILFDANRTPSAPPPSASIDASNRHLAGGIEAILRRRA